MVWRRDLGWVPKSAWQDIRDANAKYVRQGQRKYPSKAK